MTDKKSGTEITLTLKQACSIAIPAMLQTQQPKITVADRGEDVAVFAEFAADQDVEVTMHHHMVTAVSVTFKVGRQPTLAALAALEREGFTPLTFDLQTLGEGSLVTCNVVSVKLPIAIGELGENGGGFLADVLTRLMNTDIVHDGKIDYYVVVKKIIDAHRTDDFLVETGGIGACRPVIPQTEQMEAAMMRVLPSDEPTGGVPYGRSLPTQMGD